MTNIEKLWKDYFRLGEMVDREILLKKEFGRQIKFFSLFLSETNPDYHYNGTYLSRYVDEFWSFLKGFYKKYSHVKYIFDVLSSYSNLSIVIDRYWQQECIWDEERQDISVIPKVYPSIGKRLVCEEELLIECSVLSGTKRFIYQKKVQNNEEEMKEELQKIVNFLEEKVSLK